MPKTKFDFLSKVVDQYDTLKYTLLEAQTFDPSDYGFPEFYYKIMENDQRRINAFRKAFTKHGGFKNKVICEVGVGTLALTKHYLDEVKKAYLIESNPDLIPFIKKEIKKNGWDKKVELIHADALEINLPEQVDFIVGELMSIFCANELQVQVFKHMRQFLHPQGKLLPEKIINLAQLCYTSFDKNHTHFPLFFTHHLPEFYSTQEVINTIDFYREQKMKVHRKTKFRPMLSGEVNSIYLNSWIQITEGVNFTGTDSLMPPTIVQLQQPVNVKKEETYILYSDFSYGTSLDQAKFRLEKS